LEGELRRILLSKEEPWNSQAFSKEIRLGELNSFPYTYNLFCMKSMLIGCINTVAFYEFRVSGSFPETAW